VFALLMSSTVLFGQNTNYPAVGEEKAADCRHQRNQVYVQIAAGPCTNRLGFGCSSVHSTGQTYELGIVGFRRSNPNRHLCQGTIRYTVYTASRNDKDQLLKSFRSGPYFSIILISV